MGNFPQDMFVPSLHQFLLQHRRFRPSGFAEIAPMSSVSLTFAASRVTRKIPCPSTRTNCYQ
jgi:hypothetical protein